MTKDEYLAKHGPWAEVYTHISPDGTNMSIAVQELRGEIKRLKMRADLVPVNEKECKRFIEDSFVVPSKVEEMAKRLTDGKRTMPEPIVCCVYRDGTAFIADGQHRYVLAWCLHQKNIAAFVCYPAMWEQYLITDMEPLTREQLMQAPHPSQLKPSPWKQNQ